MRGLALIALCALLAISLIGCRGGGKKDDDAAAGATATEQAAGGELKAQALLPDLSSLGYKKFKELQAPLQAPGQDNYRGVYNATDGSQRMAIVDINVLSDEEVAKKVFATSAAALKNPPADFVGGAKGWDDTESPKVGDEQKSYVTTNSDSGGNRAWSDIYRIGRVVVITQLLDKASSDQLETRQALAESVAKQITD